MYDELKRVVAERGSTRETWVTKTFCLGICPQHGATVGRYPPREGHGPIETEIVPEDVDALLQASPRDRTDESAAARLGAELSRELEALVELQRSKVLALARRLKPGLTLEDVQNPHDFPELDDPDWHYADGVLAGIASVKTALSALLSESRAPSHAGPEFERGEEEGAEEEGG